MKDFIESSPSIVYMLYGIHIVVIREQHVQTNMNNI